MIKRYTYLCIAAAAVFLAATNVQAACNLIPPRGSLMPSTIAEPSDDEAIYRGQRGRINRILTAVGNKGDRSSSDRLLIIADKRCDQSALGLLNPGADTDGAPPPVFFVLRDGRQGAQRILMMTNAESCPVGIAKTFGSRFVCVDNAGIDWHLTAAGNPGISLQAPTSDQIFGTNVSSAQRYAEMNATILIPRPKRRLASSSFDQPCSEATTRDFAICIDEIYADIKGAQNRCATGPGALQPYLARVQFTAPREVFRDVCRPRRNPSSGKPQCRKQNDSLTMKLTDTGDVVAMFSWRGIRKCSGFNCDKRELFGSFAMPRYPATNAPAVRVPGREFLGSVANGNNPHDESRHKPYFDVAADPDRPNELNLFGTVDKLSSDLIVFRKYKVSKVCDTATLGGDAAALDGQACLGVRGESQFCACDGVTPRLCRCREEPSAYYSCEGGPYDGDPCTRASHCWSGQDVTAKCLPQQHCFYPTTMTDGELCTADADCTEGAGGICGRGLFYYGTRSDLTWQNEVDGTARPEGVCDEDAEDSTDQGKSGLRCSSDDDCDGNHCVRYRLSAGE